MLYGHHCSFRRFYFYGRPWMGLACKMAVHACRAFGQRHGVGYIDSGHSDFRPSLLFHTMPPWRSAGHHILDTRTIQQACPFTLQVSEQRAVVTHNRAGIVRGVNMYRPYPSRSVHRALQRLWPYCRVTDKAGLCRSKQPYGIDARSGRLHILCRRKLPVGGSNYRGIHNIYNNCGSVLDQRTHLLQHNLSGRNHPGIYVALFMA